MAAPKAPPSVVWTVTNSVSSTSASIDRHKPLFAPITFGCMLVCTLAISGLPMFSGFYSKDRIIQSAFLDASQFNGASVFAAVALPLAAMMTAFYMFRLIFMTFYGEPRDQHVYDHAHESPKTMTIALCVLAFLGIYGGKFWLRDLDFLGHHEPWFGLLVSMKTLYPGVELMNTRVFSEHAVHSAHNWALLVSLLVASTGIAGAFAIYLLRKVDPARITARLGEIYLTVRNKYYIDELVNASVIRLQTWLARTLRWVDEHIVDGIVNGVGRTNRAAGFVSAWFDKAVVDGLVNGVGGLTQAFGYVARLFQTGRIQQYVSFAVAGSLLIAAWFMLLD